MHRLMLGLLCAALLAHAQVSAQSPQQPANPVRPAQPASPAQPSQPLEAACAAPEFHQFDFWIGSWVVSDAGTEMFTTEITRADDCRLHEQWSSSVSNSFGKSVIYYDPKEGKWHQEGDSSSVITLRLTGRLEGKEMIMSGERDTPNGRVYNIITWTPLADGRVRRRWEISTDGKKTWQIHILDYYERR